MRVAFVGGSGGVGSSAAFNLLLLGAADEVLLIDREPSMVRSHVMDLEQVLELRGGGTVAAGSADDLAGADVVVLSAAVPLRLNGSRLVFLRDNAAILAATAADLPPDWPGVLLVVTNPVDPLVTLAVRRHGLDPRRTLGYTLNDSLRLRSGIARARGVGPASVDAWVIGEHGDASVPLLERVSIDGAPVSLTESERASAVAFQRDWYREHVALDSGRTSTWTSGLGVARMVAALAGGDPEPWPASVVLHGEYGVEGVALGVGVRLGRLGVDAVLDWPLSDAETAAMQAAAATVAEAVAGVPAD